MASLFEIYTGYAISEITDKPDPSPRFEKINPETPSNRVPKDNELDMSGKKPVPLPETDRELKQLHDLYGVREQHYTLEVVIPELTPIYRGDGKIIDEKTRLPLRRVFTSLLKTPTNGNLKIDVTESPSVKCYYFGGSNHSVPHITMGEQVLVYHYLGSDTYYWKEFGRDNELRRIEKYRIFVADQQQVEKGADVILKNQLRLNDDNTYYLEFDTINKHILLSTANSDGETIRYFMKFNTKTNTFALWDTKGNRFEIDSDNHRLYMRNQEQSVIDIHRTGINIWAQDSINIEADTVTTISRVTQNDVVGIKPEFKTNQVAAEKHFQSWNGPIKKDTQIPDGKGTIGPLTGPGTHEEHITTLEEVNIPGQKLDTIVDWQIQNQNYKFTGNKFVQTDNDYSHTYQVRLDTVLKTYSLIAKAYTVATIAPTIWTGNIVQGPLAKFTAVKVNYPPIP